MELRTIVFSHAFGVIRAKTYVFNSFNFLNSFNFPFPKVEFFILILLVFCHIFLHVIGMIWNALLAEETASVLGDENVVFYTYSAKVLICLEQVEVDEFLAVSACLPVVDEGGNEIYSRFVCHYEILLEAASHAQAIRAKLVRWLHLVVKTYVFLVESLHVVNVESHLSLIHI